MDPFGMLSGPSRALLGRSGDALRPPGASWYTPGTLREASKSTPGGPRELPGGPRRLRGGPRGDPGSRDAQKLVKIKKIMIFAAKPAFCGRTMKIRKNDDPLVKNRLLEGGPGARPEASRGPSAEARPHGQKTRKNR